MDPADLSVLEVYTLPLDGLLPVQAVRGDLLNGMFYSEIGRKFPRWVDELHQPRGQLPLPFSLSFLSEDGLVLGFRCGALNAETGSRIHEVWEELAEHETVIRIGSSRAIVQRSTLLKERNMSYRELHEGSPALPGLRLSFRTPARFKMGGASTLLPSPRIVWQWLVTRWEAFSKESLPPEFLRWIDLRVLVSDIDLKTASANLDEGKRWRGFIGDVAYMALDREMEIPPERYPDYLRAYQALARLTEFAGAGEKVQMGMGVVRYMTAFGGNEKTELGTNQSRHSSA